MSHYVLDKAYRVAAPDGIESARVVVRTGEPDECTLPGEANAGKILGITTHRQLRPNRFIGVRRIGIVPVLAAGPIELGAAVCVADNTGAVKQCPLPRGTTANPNPNALFHLEWLDRGSYSPSNVVKLVATTPDASFGFQFTPNGLEIQLETDGSGEPNQAVTSLVAAINGEPTLSKIIGAKGDPSSDGSGIVQAEDIVIDDFLGARNPFAVAEETAAQTGDLINVSIQL